MSRIAATLLAAVAALLAGCTGALAYWGTTGSGTGSSRTATLRAAVVRAEASESAVTLTWATEAEVERDPAAAIAYEVLRKGPGDDTYATVTRGGCAAPLARPASTCEDVVTEAGSYDYRVVAVHRSWSAVSDAGTVTVEARPEPAPTAAPQDPDPAAVPADATPPEHGAAAVALAGDADGWIDAANVAAVAVAVALDGPASDGDRVVVELRDDAGATAGGSANAAAGATSVEVTGIDARSLAETSSSVPDPAAARGLELTARVVDAAGNVNPAVASGVAGKDVTAPPVTGEHALDVRLVPAGDGAELVGFGESFDAISVVPIAGPAGVATGTVAADGTLGPITLAWPATGGARVTATDPAGNALTVDVPAPDGAPPVEPDAPPAP